jgi:hypothetical protein
MLPLKLETFVYSGESGGNKGKGWSEGDVGAKGQAVHCTQGSSSGSD